MVIIEHSRSGHDGHILCREGPALLEEVRSAHASGDFMRSYVMFKIMSERFPHIPEVCLNVIRRFSLLVNTNSQ